MDENWIIKRIGRSFLRIRLELQLDRPLIEGFGCQRMRKREDGFRFDMKNYRTFVLHVGV